MHLGLAVDTSEPLPDIPITSSDFWQSEDECTLDLLRHVFRSTTDEEIPLLEERLACLREAGQVLYEVRWIHFGFSRLPFPFFSPRPLWSHVSNNHTD